MSKKSMFTVKRKKPIFSLDFDGVIHSYKSGWKGPRTIPDKVTNGALQSIVEAQEIFQVNIFSSRSKYWFGRYAMKKWLYSQFMDLLNNPLDETGELSIPDWMLRKVETDYGEPFHHSYRYAVKEIISQIKFPLHKPPAMIGLDDRIIQFEGEWPDLEKLRNFKPYKAPY